MCCKKNSEKIDFSIFPTQDLFKEEAGKQFAAWLVRSVGWKFYKGLLENLKYVGVRYDEGLKK